MTQLTRLDAHAEESGDIATWQFLVAVEIANFATVRRQIGIDRAETLASDVATMLVTVEPDVQARVVAKDRIELELTAARRCSLDDLLADFATLFAEPVVLYTEACFVEVVFGAAAAKIGGCDRLRLLEEMDEALADARMERRPVVRDAERATTSIDSVSLARELPTAMRDNELFLQYQPKLHIRQQTVNSLEALIRWRHPVRGLILPGDFIPFAERSRDIGPLTLWTIRQVIEDQRRLAAAGHKLRVFINIAGNLLTDADFARKACALVEHGGTEIGFEITETSVIRDPESAIAHLNMFAAVGILVAIDDYGAGLSSLAYLKQLPARELKIDKLFVTQLTSSNRDPLIVRSTIDLAHALEMEVVAEGVETPAALALLSVMGCDMAQGFLISRPLGLEDLLIFLREQAEGRRSIEPPAIVRQLRRGWVHR